MAHSLSRCTPAKAMVTVIFMPKKLYRKQKSLKDYSDKDFHKSTACVRTQAQNYRKQPSANRDEFSQGSIPNPLNIFSVNPTYTVNLFLNKGAFVYDK